MRADVLQRVRETARPVVLFDVDSTLLSTGARHLSILTAYAARSGDEALQAHVTTLTPSSFSWRVDEPLTGTVHAHHAEALMAFWMTAFFSGDHLVDQPVPGALAFVQKVHRAGGWVYYLTARHLPEMGPGSATQLIQLGFPLLTGRASLHLKPSKQLGDAVFKQAALDRVAELGNVVATYENEPANANLFAERFPDALHYLVGDVHSPNAPTPLPVVQHIEDFR